MKNKKGFTISDVPNIGVLFIIIAVVLGLGVTILQGIQTAGRSNSGFVTSVSYFDSNTTFTALDSAVNVLEAAQETQDTPVCTDLYIRNITGDDVTDKFTISNCDVTITDDTTQNNTRMTANYTLSYVGHGYGYNITTAGMSSVNTLSGWQGTWVIIIAAVIVLGMVGMLLIGRRR